MSQQVLKYVLTPGALSEIIMPVDHKVLTVGMQEQMLCVWVMADLSQQQRGCPFLVVGTGMFIPDEVKPEHYLGTAFDNEWGLVWHVFGGM